MRGIARVWRVLKAGTLQFYSFLLKEVQVPRVLAEEFLRQSEERRWRQDAAP
jgi:hypothetical protein